LDQLKQRLQRERASRSEAEAIAEKSTRELYERQEQIKLLGEIAAAANEASTLEQALQITVVKICKYTRWPVGHVYFVGDDPVNGLVCSAIWHLDHPERFSTFRRITETTPMTPGIGLPGRVFSTGKPVWISDVNTDTNFPRAKQAADIGVKAGFGFPVLEGGSVVAILEFFAETAIERDERLLELISHVGAQMGRVAERMHARRELRESEERFRQLAENTNQVFRMIDVAKNRTIYVSPAFERVWGRRCADLYASSRVWFETIHPDDRLRVVEATLMKQARGEYDETFRIKRSDGAVRWIRDRGFPVRDSSGKVHRLAALAEDVTDRKAMEERFLQSQKVEAIGRLAGGVAHDFNNILTAITGYSERLLQLFAPGDSRRRNAEEIEKAAHRAANLTRQLLAYSRRQVVEPRVLDLNAVVANVEEMLQRLIGENIQLRTATQPALGAVRADVGQIEQVILNLALNARDAMPRGGKLTISTANAALDHHSANQIHDVKAGDYVMLAVSDTGTGMTDEVKAHLFEPFFTTKPIGHGTGLGLATCFGIVRQNDGYISVYSEVGKGTSFKIYFPRVLEPAEPLPPRSRPGDVPGGDETVLLVEDDSSVREWVALTLRSKGYKVIDASNGREAMQLAEQHQGKIDLVLTDVIMPMMGGKELADTLGPIRSDTRFLFTSGYAEDVIAHHGVLEAGLAFLQKPYTTGALTRKVRDVLDQSRPQTVEAK